MQEYLKKYRDYFSMIDMETYQAMRELLHSESQLKYIVSGEDGKEGIDMCKALEEIYQDGVSEGMSVGIEEGKKEMLTQLIQKRFSKGYSAEIIADMLEVELEVVQKVLM